MIHVSECLPEHRIGVFTTKRYTNPRLPLPYLPRWKIQ